MPQVDLEAIVSVCRVGSSSSDRKIACEPLPDESPENSDLDEDAGDVRQDIPPESFWLSKDAEFDWFDRNAAFLERKESTKGNANSTSNLNHSSSNSSRKFSLNLKSKAAIIGLPKPHQSNYVDKHRQGKQPRLFPPQKRSQSMTEPSSPKVSCIGRVRSKRAQRRKPEKQVAKPAERTRSGGPEKKKGFYSSLKSLFISERRCGSAKLAVKVDEPSVKSLTRKKTRSKKHAIPMSDEPVAEPVGLGGMKRFVSGRRSESWGIEEVEVARRDSVESDRSGRGGST